MTSDQLYIVTFLSGVGYFQDVADTTDSHLLMFDISDNLALSLAEED
jgi:hypothetical protein